MNTEWHVIGNEGFRFFGKMNASLSHEIKNVLAIVNENAGLLEDFILMAGKGVPIDPERIKSIAVKIQEQIRRADRIVKKMNTFAHSGDESKRQVDLREMVAFMAALSERLASMRNVTLQFAPPDNPLTITTHPFLLENIFWLCLDFAMDATGPGKTVILHVDGSEKKVLIAFSELNDLSETRVSEFPSDVENALIQALGGQIAVDVKKGRIVIHLPRTIAWGSYFGTTHK